MNDSVDITLEKRVQGQSNEELGSINLPTIPNEGDYVEKDDSKYRVHTVIHGEVYTRIVVS